MYTINMSSGVVTRDSDGKVVAPCQSTDDPDYIEYVDWVNAGNQPTGSPEPIPSPPDEVATDADHYVI